MEQKICKAIYESGCYFLSLLHLANKEDEALVKYKKYVKEGWMISDCFIADPCKILLELFGKKYSVVKSDINDQSADFVIARYVSPITKLSHFVVVNKKGEVIYDPYGKSQTVSNGYPESYRCFYEVKK